jgi:flagellar protein FliS
MSQPSREQYLESKVLTASQPKLHVMLLDGALRFGKQAQEMWAADGEFSAAEQPLTRMFDIVEELLQGLASGVGDVSQQLEEQYAFIYRQLAASRINQDAGQLESCLKLLAYQRDTWKLASQRLASDQTESTASMTPAATRSALLPHMKPNATSAPVGFSLEA